MIIFEPKKKLFHFSTKLLCYPLGKCPAGCLNCRLSDPTRVTSDPVCGTCDTDYTINADLKCIRSIYSNKPTCQTGQYAQLNAAATAWSCLSCGDNCNDCERKTVGGQQAIDCKSCTSKRYYFCVEMKTTIVRKIFQLFLNKWIKHYFFILGGYILQISSATSLRTCQQIRTCPDGTYPQQLNSGSTNISVGCLPCPSQCTACSTSSVTSRTVSCTACDSSTQLVGGACVVPYTTQDLTTVCAEGRYAYVDDSYIKCANCPSKNKV